MGEAARPTSRESAGQADRCDGADVRPYRGHPQRAPLRAYRRSRPEPLHVNDGPRIDSDAAALAPDVESHRAILLKGGIDSSQPELQKWVNERRAYAIPVTIVKSRERQGATGLAATTIEPSGSRTWRRVRSMAAPIDLAVRGQARRRTPRLRQPFKGAIRSRERVG